MRHRKNSNGIVRSFSDELFEGEDMKSVYICGPLTELPVVAHAGVKKFYSAIGDLVEEVTSVRAFVPHEHYDPVAHAHFAPEEIDIAERKQICESTSLLIVVAIEPTWGGGIEVEMANQSRVPVLILAPREKLEARKISRLLRGNPAVIGIMPYSSYAEGLIALEQWLKQFVSIASGENNG
jgi:hypothetical protein